MKPHRPLSEPRSRCTRNCECLSRELLIRGIPFRRQVPVPVVYKGVQLECGYRLDFLVDESVVVEIKAVDAMPPVYEAQLLTYLRLGGWNLGLLINFNVLRLKDGIRRRVLNLNDDRDSDELARY